MKKRKPMTEQGYKLAVALIGNTVLLLMLYYAAPLFRFFYLPVIYLLAGIGLALWYVGYNRGFNTRGKTADQLPDDIPLPEREELIADGKRRMKRSRWALTLLLPLIIVLLIDMIYLFFIPEGLLP